MADPSSALCERDRLQSEHYASGDFWNDVNCNRLSCSLAESSPWRRCCCPKREVARTELNGATAVTRNVHLPFRLGFPWSSNKGDQDAKDDLHGRCCGCRCARFDQRFLCSGRGRRWRRCRRCGGRFGRRWRRNWNWKPDRRLVHNRCGHRYYWKWNGKQRGRSERWRQQPFESFRQQPYAQLAWWHWDRRAAARRRSIGYSVSVAGPSGSFV